MYASTGNGTGEWDTSASSSAAISNAAFAKSNERAVPSFLKGFESFPISFAKLHRDTYNNANKSKSPHKNSPKIQLSCIVPLKMLLGFQRQKREKNDSMPVYQHTPFVVT
jgi:hypothetical protein